MNSLNSAKVACKVATKSLSDPPSIQRTYATRKTATETSAKSCAAGWDRPRSQRASSIVSDQEASFFELALLKLSVCRDYSRPLLGDLATLLNLASYRGEANGDCLDRLFLLGGRGNRGGEEIQHLVLASEQHLPLI